MSARPYIRDARSPTPSSPAASRIMAANRATDTKPELTLRRALWARGIRGYRLHAPGIPGRPDIAFPAAKLAIFVHGCFWHHCPACAMPTPRSNTKFWTDKFARNRARDAAKVEALQRLGWRTLTFWEHEIRDSLPAMMRMIERALRSRA